MKNKKEMSGSKVVVLVSITSDIGTALAKKYSNDGYTIIGTYRSTKQLDRLKDIPDCHLIYCDLSDKRSMAEFIEKYIEVGVEWDMFVSCPCELFPIKAFFQSDFEEWNNSVHINAIEQLRILHQLYGLRNKNAISNVVFFAGPGVNNSVKNFSAYAISKIILIKMCEYLDAENEDLNIFIVGPGWTRTKSHDLVLEKLDKGDEKYIKTLEFIESGKGTSMEDIYKCINWLCQQGKKIASGRNFSVVHDKWKGVSNQKLATELKADINMYKLRRHKNDFFRG